MYRSSRALALRRCAATVPTAVHACITGPPLVLDDDLANSEPESATPQDPIVSTHRSSVSMRQIFRTQKGSCRTGTRTVRVKGIFEKKRKNRERRPSDSSTELRTLAELPAVLVHEDHVFPRFGDESSDENLIEFLYTNVSPFFI
jgi:hypothetical protein